MTSDGVAVVSVLVSAPLGPDGATSTPKTNVPALACPSTADTTRQCTVYTPRPSGRTRTESESGSLATG